MAIIPVSTTLLTSAGLVPHNLARNGIPPSGPAVRAIADGVNFILGNRVRFLAAKYVKPAQSYAVSGVQTTYRFRTRLTPNGTTVRIRMVLIPTDTHTTTPAGWWVVTNKDTSTVEYDDGTLGTDRRITLDSTLATPTSAVPSDYVYVQRMFTGLTGGADYTFEFKQQNILRPLGFTAYEVARTSLDTASDAAVDTARLVPDRPIYDADVLDLLTGIQSAWEKQGPQHVAWTVHNITPVAVSTATETNLIDGTTTTNGWTATSAGVKCYAMHHDSADTRKAATYSVPVRAYVYASDLGGAGTVRFRYGTGAAEHIAVTAIGATAGWYTATGTVPLGNADGSKIDLTGMAGAVTLSAASLDAAGETTDATSFATASISPTANRLVLAWVSNLRFGEGTAAAPTLTGAGMTWVQVATVSHTQNPEYRVTLFRALNAAPGSGAVTISFGAETQNTCHWSIEEWSGVDTSGTDGSGAIVQSGTAQSASAASLTVTLAAFGSATNAVAAGFMRGSLGSGWTPETGYTTVQ
ncbi:MAG: hypothetical protein AAB706_02830, partial [Patescibacteria group bacterium]